MEDVYYTESQFSDRYQVPRRTAQRWRTTGEGPAFVRLGQRRVLYRQSDIETWLKSRTFASRAAEAAQKAV